MKTCEPPILPNSEDSLLFSVPESRANPLVLPGSDEARQMTVGSGRQLSMLLDQSSPLGAFSKILLESKAFTHSEEFCYVWRVWDTRLDCSAFRLTPLAQSTAENGFSLWPTAHANCHTGAGTQGRDGVLNLQTAAKLWPTPNGGNFNDGEDLESWEVRRQKNKAKGINGNGQGTPLAIAAKLWPTPRRDHSGLESHGVTAIGGSLNPRFVEELMGYEIDHTALRPSETRSFRSKPTRSSRRSRKSKAN